MSGFMTIETILRLKCYSLNRRFLSRRMRSPHLYWHIYPQQQIRAELRGNLLLVLEVPWAAWTPVLRNIFDPAGRDFPRIDSETFLSFMQSEHHGILYAGLSKPAVYDLMLADPPMPNRDADYALYNHEIVARARNYFLVDPNLGFKSMPDHMTQLL